MGVFLKEVQDGTEQAFQFPIPGLPASSFPPLGCLEPNQNDPRVLGSADFLVHDVECGRSPYDVRTAALVRLVPSVRMTMVAAKFQGWLAEPGRAQELKDVKKGNL